MSDAPGDDLESAVPRVSYPDMNDPTVKVLWSRQRVVPRSFRLRFCVARFVWLVSPPVTRTTVALWAVLIGCIVGLWVWFWYVGGQLPGAGSTNTQVRWAADVSGLLIVLLVVVLPLLGAGLFRGGTRERAKIVGYTYGVTARGRWVRLQLVAIRRVRRLFGVVAIQLPNKKYLVVPSQLFLTASEWEIVQRRLSSN